MGKDVTVDDHAYKHGLTEQEIRYAWDHFVRMLHRGSPREGQILAIGCDLQGRLVQMAAVERFDGVLIFHAMRPPTRNALLELGFIRGGK